MVSRRAFVGSLLATSAVAQRDLSDISTLIKDKSLSPVELTKACLQRIEALNPKLNAFITVTATAAIREAESLESELRAGKRRGPLHGIPIGLKDLYDTAGVKTTAGSKHWADRVPADDASVVARLRAAGAILAGPVLPGTGYPKPPTGSEPRRLPRCRCRSGCPGWQCSRARFRSQPRPPAKAYRSMVPERFFSWLQGSCRRSRTRLSVKSQSLFG